MPTLFLNFIDKLNLATLIKVVVVLIFALIFYLIFNVAINSLKARLLKKARTKRERSNIQISFQLIRYIFTFLIIIFGILSFVGSLAGIGLAAGFITAALGWALQRPIAGFAAWLMVVIKRPFEIGDRIIIGNVSGDVVDINLTHVHIGEIGGTIAAEESSGRIIMIPNAKLFEEVIINYTKDNENILDEVKFSVTYESNLEEAKTIAINSAKAALKDFGSQSKPPYLRVWFQPSGVDVVVRYFVPAANREEVRSNITQDIFRKVMTSKSVEFAYPHTEVIFRKK